MDDLISRQAAIDTEGLEEEIRCEMCKNPMHTDRGCDGNCKYDEKLYEKITQILDKRITPLPSAQPEKRTEERAETHACDLIDRQAAIACACSGLVREMDGENWRRVADIREDLRNMPPVPQTLYGYNIDHLKLIAEVLRKENLSPERVVEAITDIGRIASIIRAECEEELKKSVERCMI